MKFQQDKFFAVTQRQLNSFFETLAGLFIFSTRFFKEVFLPPYEVVEIRKHMIELGMKTLPIVGVTGFIIGLVMTMQLQPVLQRFGAEAFLPGSIAITIVRELGPVITALIFAGRVSSGIGAELGSMRVTEQIDAMEVSGVNPFRFLVVTRVFATTIILPILTVYVIFISLIIWRAKDTTTNMSPGIKSAFVKSMQFMNKIEGDRYVDEDGNVAVLVSHGFGGGWSTWGSEELALCPKTAKLVDGRDNRLIDSEQLVNAVAELYPDAFTGGVDDLSIEWLPKGTQFRITEYDGSEDLEVIGNIDYQVT